MKKFSIILNVVLTLAVLFLIMYAQIQTKLAAEQTAMTFSNANDAKKSIQLAQNAAKEAEVAALEAQAKALEAQVQLEICQNSK